MKIGIRKIVLLACIVVLAVLCIVANVTGKKSGIKILKLSDSPDEIVMTSADKTLTLHKSGEDWTINDSDFTATKAYADNIEKVVKELKVLAKSGNASSDSQLEKFGFSDSKKIVVQARKNGSVLRTITVGKVSSTSTQSFIMVDGSSTVYLVSGNLPAIFGKSESDIRNHLVYKIDGNKIKSVSVLNGTRLWGVERTSEIGADNAAWKWTGAAPQASIDNDEADVWVMMLDSLTASEWIEGDMNPVDMSGEVNIDSEEGQINLKFYKVGTGSDVKYVCSSNRSKHKFYVLKSTMEKYLKDPAELGKK